MDEATGIEFPFYQGQMYDIFGEPFTRGEFAESYLRTMDFSEFRPYFAHVVDYEGNPGPTEFMETHRPRIPCAGLLVSSWRGGWPRNSRRGTAVSISGL